MLRCTVRMNSVENKNMDSHFSGGFDVWGVSDSHHVFNVGIPSFFGWVRRGGGREK